MSNKLNDLYWRRLDIRPIPSATRPRETVLSAGPVPDFLVVFEGYAGGAEHWRQRWLNQDRSLEADILRTSRLRSFGAEPVAL